ncbi:MAG: pyridoxamine 5'-phosphate oxidase, partial [Neisseriaceae bacterium]|nr:pyridoxamine 5'-phosphate oxidase [Neisseriaceae bacterium]
NVSRPPHWGGYMVRPEEMEFWQGRPSRLHDRICYRQHKGQWTKERLSP